MSTTLQIESQNFILESNRLSAHFLSKKYNTNLLFYKINLYNIFIKITNLYCIALYNKYEFKM